MYHKSRRIYNKYETENIFKIVSKKYKRPLTVNNKPTKTGKLIDFDYLKTAIPVNIGK